MHCRFAQVVVNAEHLAFAEDAAHGVIDSAVAGQVMAERLLQHHPGLWGVQAGGGQLLADGGEQGGRGGHVHHHSVSRALGQCGAKPGVVVWAGQVHADKRQQGGKAGKFFEAGAFGQFDLVKTGADQLAVCLFTEVVPAHADDATALWQRAMPKGLEQGWHQFAPDQIASATKQNEVKGHDFRLHKFRRCNVTLFQR